MKDSQRCDEIDTTATQVAEAYQSGNIQERDALAECARLVMESSPADQVANSTVNGCGHNQVRADVAERLLNLTLDKILDQNGSRSNLSLDVIAAGGSLMGWARDFMFAAAKSELRNTNRQTLSTHEPVEDPDMSGVKQLASAQEDGLTSRYDDYVDARDIVDLYEARVRGKRTSSRLHEQARAITDMLNIPALVDMTDMGDQIVEMCDADHRLAHTLATNVLHTDGQLGLDEASKTIVEAWKELETDELVDIVDADPRFADILVRSAATSRRSPHRDLIVAVEADMSTLKRSPGWEPIVRKMVRAYVAFFYGDGNSERFDQSLEKLSSYRKLPFDRDRDAVIRYLDVTFDRVETEMALYDEDSRIVAELNA